MRIRADRKVMSLALLTCLVVWCFDAAVDNLLFGKGSFIDLVVLDVPAYEFFVRGVFSAFIITFGLLVSRMMYREREVTEKMTIRDKALASSVSAFTIADLEGRLTYVNRSFLRFLGYDSEQEVLGTPAAAYAYSLEEGEKTIQELREKGNLIREFSAKRKDGSRLELDLSANLVLGAEGSPICMIASFTDITKRKRLEEEREHLASFPRLNPNPIIELDLSGNIVFYNDAAADTLKALGMPVDIQLFLPDDLSSVLDALLQETSKKFYREIVINASTFAENITLAPIFSTVRIYITEITGLKRAEEKLNQSKEDLEQQVLDRTMQLNITNQDLEKEKDHIKTTNVLLELFTRNLSLKEYLNAVIEIVQKWSGCCCFGIRVLDKNGNWPFEASTGFTEEFLKSEHLITAKENQCACILVATQQPAPQDLPAMTKFGSFYSNDYPAFIRGYADKENSRHCGVCMLTGFRSVAVVPIHYQGNVLAVIHMADEEANRVPLSNIKFIETVTHIIGGALYKYKTDEELRNSQDQLRSLTHHMQELREKERTVIAREIHDELGQMLTALKMDSSRIEQIPAAQEEVSRTAKSMTALINTAIQAVKRITTELRPGTLDYLTISEAIAWQAEEFEKRMGISCDVISVPDEIVLDKDISINLFRVFQEILTNIANHAGATQVLAKMEMKDGLISLSVADNGKGITFEQASRPDAFGLIGMRERIHGMGGTISFAGIPEKGTTVSVAVPLQNRQASFLQ